MNISGPPPAQKPTLKRGSNSVYGYTSTATSLSQSTPSTEFSSAFDYVMVFPMKGDQHQYQSNVSRHCINVMISAGLEVFPYLSVQNDELLVLIRAPLSTLESYADKINYKLKVDPANLETILKAGDAVRRINPIDINDKPEFSPISPYDHIYLEYGNQHDPKLYSIPYGEENPFAKSVRLKLVYLMLRAPKREGGCGLELSHLLHKGSILAMYPLHDKGVAKNIQHKCWEWGCWPWNAPVHDIKEYFGEKIALYNVFLGHYSHWLIWPSIIGLVFQLVVWGTLDFSHPVLPFYSLVITVWSVYMLEFWKRQESWTAMTWGMSDFEQLEQDRPEFNGETIKSYVNGRDMTYYPASKLARLARFSRAVVLTFIVMVIGVVAAIYVFRFYLQSRKDTYSASSTIASILNTVQITIFNMIYQIVAKKLTDLENHRTDTSYEDSLIVKLFVFQFINSYASFFFLAFIAGNLNRPDQVPSNFLGQCGATNCMEPLSINLAIIFGSRLTITNFIDIFLPYYKHKAKAKSETKGIAEDKKFTPAEKDYYLLNYDPMIESIQNYADTAVQYGFTLLFITALPIASMFSLINCYFKVKFNAWKLSTFFQRPIPSGAQDIGTWMTIFQVISVASVITNAGLVCFTMDVLWSYSLQGRVWIFMGFQWVLIMLQFIGQAVIPDVPEEVEVQLQRLDFINTKVIEKVEDEDFGMTEEMDHANYEDADERAEKKGGCCAVKLGKKKKARIQKGLSEWPLSTYPADVLPINWPKPLQKQATTDVEDVAPVVVEDKTPKFTNYASNSKAAVDATPNYY